MYVSKGLNISTVSVLWSVLQCPSSLKISFLDCSIVKCRLFCQVFVLHLVQICLSGTFNIIEVGYFSWLTIKDMVFKNWLKISFIKFWGTKNLQDTQFLFTWFLWDWIKSENPVLKCLRTSYHFSTVCTMSMGQGNIQI
jgi:hypothetical protein